VGAIPSVIISSDLHAPVHGINPDTHKAIKQLFIFPDADDFFFSFPTGNK
jgi:hypothetical protein